MGGIWMLTIFNENALTWCALFSDVCPKGITNILSSCWTLSLEHNLWTIWPYYVLFFQCRVLLSIEWWVLCVKCSRIHQHWERDESEWVTQKDSVYVNLPKEFPPRFICSAENSCKLRAISFVLLNNKKVSCLQFWRVYFSFHKIMANLFCLFTVVTVCSMT